MSPARRPRLRATVAKVAVFTAVSVLLTSVVITSLLDSNVHPTSGYTVDLADAAGLQAGDTVRIAGVEVGKVSSVALAGDHARVAFSVDSDQHLTTTTRATIHFANLLGQRFLALLPGTSPGAPLRAGGDIPIDQTTPALDLTAVFDGFQPLFSALAPDQVNKLALSVIQVFQGESGTVAGLVQQTAAITNDLADRSQIITALLTNLAGLLNTVGAHDAQLGQLVTSFDSLVSGLAHDHSQLAGTIASVSQLTTTVAGQLASAQPALDGDITGLQDAVGHLAADQTQVDGVLRGLPGVLNALTKVQSTGNYLDVYICNLTVNVVGQVDVSLIPGVPAPQFGDPFTLPSGAVGDQGTHTRTCTP